MFHLYLSYLALGLTIFSTVQPKKWIKSSGLKKILSIFFSFCIFSFLLKAQSNDSISEKDLLFISGTSLTYIWDTEPHLYQEWTFSFNMAFPFKERFRFGINTFSIFTKSPLSGENRYFLFGGFSQFDFFPKEKYRFYAELSLYHGNYCTCEPDDPYKKPGLIYLGIGGGFDLAIRNDLHLDLAFLNHQILDRVKSSYAYTQYVIGIDFYLFVKRKEKWRNQSSH